MKTPILAFLSISLFFQIKSKDSYIQIQNLYKKISQDLIKLKKENPGSQKIIYPMLDSIGQLAKISKNTIEKKKNLKSKIKTMNINLSQISQENNRLKSDLLDFSKRAENNQQKIVQEKKKISANLSQILEKNSKLERKVQELQNQNQKYKEKSRVLAENLEKQGINTDNKSDKNQEESKEDQNLNLSSTSDPKSPL